MIADEYLLPPHIDWDSFLLRIPESEIHRLPELVEPYLATSSERGRLAREAYLTHFDPPLEFDCIVEGCFEALHHGPPAEAVFRRRQKKMIAQLERRRKLRLLAKKIVLTAFKVLHIKNPYQMNER